MKNRKKLGKWDFDGECKPQSSGFFYGGQETFSVSIFQWIQNKSGGLKKSKSVYRVKGSVNQPEKVYKRAGKICDQLDSGCTSTMINGGRKSETV